MNTTKKTRNATRTTSNSEATTILKLVRAALPKGESIKVYNDKRQTDRRIRIESASKVALVHAGAVLVRLGVPIFEAGYGIAFLAPL